MKVPQAYSRLACGFGLDGADVVGVSPPPAAAQQPREFISSWGLCRKRGARAGRFVSGYDSAGMLRGMLHGM